MPDFKSYIELLRKIDVFAVALKANHAASMLCRPGCAKCCVAGITVWQIERDRIDAHLANHPAPAQKSRPEKCAFLKDDDTCAIYDVRPLVCRLWGLPLLLSSGDVAALSTSGFVSAIERGPEKTLMSCELNFKGTLDALPKDDILNADIVLTMLAAINHVYCRAKGADPARRFPI